MVLALGGAVPELRSAGRTLRAGPGQQVCKPCPAILPHVPPAATGSPGQPPLGLHPNVPLTGPHWPVRHLPPGFQGEPQLTPPAHAQRARSTETSHPGHLLLVSLSGWDGTRGTQSRSQVVWSPHEQIHHLRFQQSKILHMCPSPGTGLRFHNTLQRKPGLSFYAFQVVTEHDVPYHTAPSALPRRPGSDRRTPPLHPDWLPSPQSSRCSHAPPPQNQERGPSCTTQFASVRGFP